MKTPIKIITTQPYEDTIVCNGKVLFIPTHSALKPKVFFKWGLGLYQPIIISKIEKIEIGDKVKNDYDEIVDYTEKLEKLYGKNNPCFKKIIALPDNFSPKQLQDIVEKKLHNGDEVFVECYENADCGSSNCRNGCSSVLNGGDWCSGYYTSIKFDKDNHITLFSVKEQESWEDIDKKWGESDMVNPTQDNIFKWLKQNYNPPTKK